MTIMNTEFPLKKGEWIWMICVGYPTGLFAKFDSWHGESIVVRDSYGTVQACDPKMKIWNMSTQSTAPRGKKLMLIDPVEDIPSGTIVTYESGATDDTSRFIDMVDGKIIATSCANLMDYIDPTDLQMVSEHQVAFAIQRHMVNHPLEKRLQPLHMILGLSLHLM